MVSSKGSKVFHFGIFIIPALLLYCIFFILPLIQGVQYSFTDWNGIAPMVPLSFEKKDYEDVVAKIKNKKEQEYLKSYYIEDGDIYSLTSWIVSADGEERQITDKEKKKLRSILKKVGISPIKFIGMANYVEMFKGDERFVPRIQRNYLFKEYDDLRGSIDKKIFENNILKNITKQEDKDYITKYYKFDEKQNKYVIQSVATEDESLKLKTFLSKNMYRDDFIPGVLGFTVFFTVLNVLGANLLALALALALDSKLKTTNVLRSIFFLPNVLSLIIVAFIWSFVFRLILPAVTGIDVWLGDTNIAPYAVVIVSIWQSCGYLMIIYLAGLQTIPQDIIEVAELDGANGFQKFSKITLPLLVPSITICTFYSIANSLKTFEVPFALTSGGPGYSTTNIVLDIYFNSFNLNRFAYGTAKAVFLCLVIMLITGIQLYLMKRKEVEL